MAHGIALIPDSKTIEDLVAYQNIVSDQYGLTPKQTTSLYLPHVTLLQGLPGVSFLDETGLIEIVKDRPPQIDGRVSFGKTHYEPKGWYFLSVERTGWMVQLHEAIFARFKSRLAVASVDKSKDLSGYTVAEKENYMNFGYRYIGNSWKPHVTIGRTSDGQPLPDEEEIFAMYSREFADRSVYLDTLTVYDIGINGGHRETLASFKLQPDGNHG